DTGVREFVILIFGILTALFVLAPGKRALQAGFVLWIFTFGLGWRTIEVTKGIVVHPSEALVWLLFAVMLIQGVLSGHRPSLKIPYWIPILLGLGVVGLMTAGFRGTAIETDITE